MNRIKKTFHPLVFASMLLGALAGGLGVSVSAQWKCEQPKVTYEDDNCTCEKRGCKPSKEGVEDPFMVCDYLPKNCPSDFKCPPLDPCSKYSFDLE